MADLTDDYLDMIAREASNPHPPRGASPTDTLRLIRALRTARAEVEDKERDGRLRLRAMEQEHDRLRAAVDDALDRDRLARLMRVHDTTDPDHRGRLGRWWDAGDVSPDVKAHAYQRADAVRGALAAHLGGDRG